MGRNQDGIAGNMPIVPEWKKKEKSHNLPHYMLLYLQIVVFLVIHKNQMQEMTQKVKRLTIKNAKTIQCNKAKST
jgi:hypothetical protein